jgi:signal transduction histidine kinase
LWFVAAIAAEILGEAGVLTPIFYGEFGFLGFALALSLQMSNEIIKTEEELADYRSNLEVLVDQRTAELHEAQEKLVEKAQVQATVDERSRLARDLHDAVTQTIYSAALIAESLPAVWDRNPAEGRRNLTKLRQLVRGALAEMRTLLFELRPDSLVASELESLLQLLSDAFTGQTRIPVTIQVDGAATLPADVKISFYRIVQEAFNNIEKHAHADQVSVRLHQGDEWAILVIQDNGSGFDQTGHTTEQMGINIMRERAEIIGASLQVTSHERQGTTVTLSWPDPA